MGNQALSLSNYNFSSFSLKRLLKSKPKRTILMCGLNNSGKTTLLCNFAPSMLDHARGIENIEQVSTCPTPGLSLVEFQQGRIKWRVWDMSGQGRFRNLWAYYSGHVQGIIFCIDVTDGDRIATARDELQVRELLSALHHYFWTSPLGSVPPPPLHLTSFSQYLTSPRRSWTNRESESRGSQSSFSRTRRTWAMQTILVTQTTKRIRRSLSHWKM